MNLIINFFLEPNPADDCIDNDEIKNLSEYSTMEDISDLDEDTGINIINNYDVDFATNNIITPLEPIEENRINSNINNNIKLNENGFHLNNFNNEIKRKLFADELEPYFYNRNNNKLSVPPSSNIENTPAQNYSPDFSNLQNINNLRRFIDISKKYRPYQNIQGKNNKFDNQDIDKNNNNHEKIDNKNDRNCKNTLAGK